MMIDVGCVDEAKNRGSALDPVPLAGMEGGNEPPEDC